MKKYKLKKHGDMWIVSGGNQNIWFFHKEKAEARLKELNEIACAICGGVGIECYCGTGFTFDKS